MPVSPERRVLLQEQAADMRVRYPELYEHLRQRDVALRRFLARIPSPADVELSASFNLPARLLALRHELSSGLDDLSESSSQP